MENWSNGIGKFYNFQFHIFISTKMVRSDFHHYPEIYNFRPCLSIYPSAGKHSPSDSDRRKPPRRPSATYDSDLRLAKPVRSSSPATMIALSILFGNPRRRPPTCQIWLFF
ncbi:hypothetical protein K1719_009444 [Acacia pycnantha]|nr:hypothetical protein K1719_009444 [Acacia pycnantha]